MTAKDREETVKNFEKKWYQSKKFIAFVLMEVGFFLAVLLTIKWNDEIDWPVSVFLVSCIFSAGFMALAFNGKQAQLDMYVRGIALTGKSPNFVKKAFGGLFGGKPEFQEREDE